MPLKLRLFFWWQRSFLRCLLRTRGRWRAARLLHRGRRLLVEWTREEMSKRVMARITTDAEQGWH